MSWPSPVRVSDCSGCSLGTRQHPCQFSKSIVVSVAQETRRCYPPFCISSARTMTPESFIPQSLSRSSLRSGSNHTPSQSAHNEVPRVTQDKPLTALMNQISHETNLTVLMSVSGACLGASRPAA
eukprot:1104570-Rhodomonas_salina.2